MTKGKQRLRLIGAASIFLFLSLLALFQKIPIFITRCAYMLERYALAIDCIQYTLLNGDSGITRDLVTMATQSITTGGCDMDDDGDGSQGTAEHNFVPQPSTSPEPVSNLPCNQKQIKSRPYTSKEVLSQKVQ